MSNLVSLSDDGARALLFIMDGAGPPGPSWAPHNYEYNPESGRLSRVGPDAPITMTKDGRSLLAVTPERLVTGDLDSSADLYRLRGDEVTLISATADPAFSQGVWSYQSSAAGDRVYFAAAGDKRHDDSPNGFQPRLYSIWVWDRGESHLVTDEAGPEGVAASILGGVSDDGSALAFSTVASLDPADRDSNVDAYRYRLGQGFDLISTGPADQQADEGLYENFGSAEQISADGSRVFFVSTEQLVGDDTDTVEDIYMRTGQSTVLITRGTQGWGPPVPGALPWGTFGGVSDDGRHVAFETSHALVTGDDDLNMDVYEWVDGSLRLVSVGTTVPPTEQGFFQAISRNGRQILFRAYDPLSPFDNDDELDFYVSEEVAGSSRGATASRVAPRRRIRMVSVEAIPPRMKVNRSGTGRLRLQCPRVEENGPCRGTVRIRRRSGEIVAKARFTIRVGRTESVRFRPPRRGDELPSRVRALVVVRARDRVGNSKRTRRRMALRLGR